MVSFGTEKTLLALAQVELLQAAFEWDKQNSWVKRTRDGRFGSGSSQSILAPKDRVTDNPGVRESLSKVGISPDEVAIALERLESRPKDFSPIYSMILLPFQREYLASRNLKQQDLERFDRRIREVNKIVAQGNWENSKDLAWRVGAIKAEVKYGDLINDLVDISLPAEGRSGLKPLLDIFKDNTAYKKLLKRLNKKTQSNAIRQVSSEEAKAIQDLFRKVQDVTPIEQRMTGIVEIPEDRRDSLIKTAVKPGKAFQELVYPKLDAILDALMERGFTTSSAELRKEADKMGFSVDPALEKDFRYINVGNYKGQAVKFVMDHELGHQLEIQLKQVETSKRFIDARATSPFLQDLKEYGMPGEKVRPDNFSHPYTGKVYDTDATEVVSTATQALVSPMVLSVQSYLDREHIMYGLSVMDMKEGDRFPGGEK
jgi:hypothetical protein